MKKLLASLADLDIGEWLRGLFAALISGGSSAVIASLTVSSGDPYYSFEGGRVYMLMLNLFIVNGLLGAMMFLRQKPVPDHRVVVKTVETAVEKPKGTVTTTTVEETHTEPTPTKL